MRFFTEDDVRRLLPMPDAIARLRQVFADYASGLARNQPRRRLMVDTGAVLHSLAGAWGGYFGTKVYSTHPKYGANFTVILYDAETARPLAQYEANLLGQIRTGAVSGLAADILAPRGPVRVGCVGSGFQARSQLEALAAIRQIESIRVWSRHPENREQFAREISDLLRVPVSAASSSADAAASADILITATWSKDPVIEADAVAEGTLVLAMGSNHPQRRELPSDLVTRSFVVVEDKEACRIEAGDLLLAFSEENWNQVTELKDLVQNPSGSEARGSRTAVFKSVGLGLEDVAVASLIYERAASPEAAIPAQGSADPHRAMR